jgi:hypothetical protein
LEYNPEFNGRHPQATKPASKDLGDNSYRLMYNGQPFLMNVDAKGVCAIWILVMFEREEARESLVDRFNLEYERSEENVIEVVEVFSFRKSETSSSLVWAYPKPPKAPAYMSIKIIRP